MGFMIDRVSVNRLSMKVKFTFWAIPLMYLQ